MTFRKKRKMINKPAIKFNNNNKQTNHEQEQPIIVGLDIGTTKIAAIAGRKNEFGKLEILGFGRANRMVLNTDRC